MISTDEDALICDLAETYGIFDYRSLPVRLVATLSVGLRGNSRIKMKMSNTPVSIETMLQAMAVDRLSMLWWAKTKDGEKGVNRPQSIVSIITGDLGETHKKVASFATPEAFETARRKLLQKED